VLGEDVRSWREFDGEIERFAQGLERYGIGRGKTVAMLLPNGFEAMAAIFGTARAGASVVPLSPLLQPEVLSRLASDAGASLLVAGAPYGEIAAKITGFPPSHRVSVGLDDGASGAPYDHAWRGIAHVRFVVSPTKLRGFAHATCQQIVISRAFFRKILTEARSRSPRGIRCASPNLARGFVARK